MKRDFELLKQILIMVEDAETFDESVAIKIPGRSGDVIEYHVILLHEAGLINCDQMEKDYGHTMPMSLTMAGCDFLDASRSDSIWKKVFGVIKDKGGAVTIDIVKQLLISEAKRRLGLP